MHTGSERAIATKSLRRNSAGSRECPRTKGCDICLKAAEIGERMLKVAIVGCGKIADSHASQIQRIKGCEIVGVCDGEPLMALQLSKRFPIKQHFSDLMQLLEEARPDVVHI